MAEDEEKDVVSVVVEKEGKEEEEVVVMEKEEEEEGTCSSKYPNLYSRHPCEYHRLCVREKRNSQLKEDTKPRGGIRLHRSDDVYFLV